jgi:hypothetical protein
MVVREYGSSESKSSSTNWDWKGQSVERTLTKLQQVECLGGTTVEKRLVDEVFANFDRKLTDDEYNWMMEGRAKVGLCDGLLNSEDFQQLTLPYENRTVQTSRIHAG